MKKSSDNSKINVAVIFGGKSVEHEISIISAIQAMESLDRSKYQVFPVYITKDNQFFYNDKYQNISIFQSLDNVQKLGKRVIFTTSKTTYGTPKTHLVSIDEKNTHDFGIIDVTIPIVHGTNVEDGALAGLLNLYNLPQTFSDVFSSALCMDKWASKLVLERADVPVLPAVHLRSSDVMSESVQRVEAAFSYPVIVKPVNLGSSVGISIAHDAKMLQESCELAFTFASQVIVEQVVQNMREFNCSVLGDAQNCQVSAIEEVYKDDVILSFEDKYLSGSSAKGSSKQVGKLNGTKYTQMANATKGLGGLKAGGKSGMVSLSRQVPAQISESLQRQIEEIAKQAFQELSCHGLVRIDFIMDVDTNTVVLNEINTVPGSLSYYLWQATGVSYPELLDKLIDLAFARVRDRSDMSFSFDSNVLAGMK